MKHTKYDSTVKKIRTSPKITYYHNLKERKKKKLDVNYGMSLDLVKFKKK
jgi:hypothetical protein